MIRWIFGIIKVNIEYLPKTLSFAKVDLKKAHMSSDFGWFWAIAKPLAYILMFYFAISSGFKGGKDVEGTVCPYFIWLASGIVPWQYISDLLVGGANCFFRRRSLIVNARYPATAIPTIPVLSRLFIHLIMVCILIVMAVIMGVRPSIYWLQLPIYMALAIMFIYVWVMMTALMNILSADILEFIKTIRTAFFWLSGILFNIRGKRSLFFKLNPISYIVEGYRNTFAYHIWIWEEKRLFMYFAIVMIFLTLITFILYKRLEKKLPELV